MTTVLDLPLTDLDAALDFEPDIPCVMRQFCNPSAHAAAWWITLSCGCPYPTCQTALRIANLRLRARPLTCRLCGEQSIAIHRVARI